jgi:uncharacterized protein (TIGR02246 family)
MNMSAEDRLDIFDLFARYAWAYDCGDAEAYAAVFTPDGILADQKDLRAVGRPAIREAVGTFFQQRGSNVWQHHNNHLRMQGGGRACRVWSYWSVMEHRHADGGYGVRSLGYYLSDCVKQHGTWFFSGRTFYMDMPPVVPWMSDAKR